MEKMIVIRALDERDLLREHIKDMIDRYKRLEAVIFLVNTTTNIEVAGITMTRAVAINLHDCTISTKRLFVS